MSETITYPAKPKRPVKLIEEQGEFEELCRQLAGEPMIGLDVETTIYARPRILCTVQLATETQNWVIDVLALVDILAIKPLMESPSVKKIIHNASFERGVLRQFDIELASVFDTLHASRKHRADRELRHTLGDVCRRELGINMDKSYQSADWTLRPLSQGHIDYAALDAEVLIDLYDIFSSMELPR